MRTPKEAGELSCLPDFLAVLIVGTLARSVEADRGDGRYRTPYYPRYSRDYYDGYGGGFCPHGGGGGYRGYAWCDGYGGGGGDCWRCGGGGLWGPCLGGPCCGLLFFVLVFLPHTRPR